MSLLGKPIGAGCNLGCKYCYETSIRKSGNAGMDKYNLDTFKAAMRREWENRREIPTMHGGEFLLLPKKDVEELLRLSYELSGGSSLQTNGTLIDDDHISMFIKYKTVLGVSIDGPGILNRGRWAGSLEKTDENTEKIMDNIRKMRKYGISIGIIAVLSRLHVDTPNAMKMMKDWMIELRDIGVNSGRLNPVEVDIPEMKKQFEITPEELGAIYKELGTFCLTTPGLYWQPFRDVVDNLMGFGMGTCVYTKCDYQATNGAVVISQDGSLHNCLKTAKDGVDYMRADDGEQHERYIVLSQTPDELGGCKGCRYWKICYGHCPAEGIDGDWRNKSRYCQAYRENYQNIENLLKSMLPNLKTICDYPEIEDDYLLRYYQNSKFDGFALMNKNGTSTPSTWRGNAFCNAKNREKPNFPNGFENQSRSIVNFDKSMAHGDAHGDSHGDHSDHSDVGTKHPEPKLGIWRKVE